MRQNWYREQFVFLLAYPDGTGEQDSFVVYHVKDNGEIENMPVQLSANGIVIETTGFSDFVVSYDIVRSADTTHNTDTDDVKNSRYGANTSVYSHVTGSIWMLWSGSYIEKASGKIKSKI